AATSAPDRTPLSRRTSTLSPTASTTPGRISSGVAVELTPAVVGHHDRVHAEPGDAARVVDGLDALDDQWPGPLAAQPLDVGELDRRVEHRVDDVGERVRPPAPERGELQRRGGEEVRPPPGLDGPACERAPRQRGWERHAVVYVAQPRAGDRHVDGQDERL